GSAPCANLSLTDVQVLESIALARPAVPRIAPIPTEIKNMLERFIEAPRWLRPSRAEPLSWFELLLRRSPPSHYSWGLARLYRFFTLREVYPMGWLSEDRGSLAGKPRSTGGP